MTTSSPVWLADGSPLADPQGKGERAVRFLQLLKHPKSTAPGHRFQLAPWMERIVRRVYGDTDENGVRRTKTVFLLLPRGNRKTTLGSGLALLHTLGPERIPGGQAMSAAVDRDQARVAFEEATGIVRATPALDAVTKLQDANNRLTHRSTGAFYRAISHEAGSAHGRTPSFVLADELHAWKKPDLGNVLRTGLVKVPGSLMFVITTAGIGQTNLAFDIYGYAKRVAAGEVDDPGFLPILFEASADADWRDEAVWAAVNPGLAHGFPDIEGLRQLAREAEERPAQREAFRQLHLNMWLDGAPNPAFDLSVWDEGAEDLDLSEFDGAPCWIAVDLSKTTDLTAVVACFLDAQGRYVLVPHFFVPEAGMRRRSTKDKVPYVLWAEQKLITPTPGDVVDLDRVEHAIRALCERHEVQEIAMDPWGARPMINRLLEDGLPVTEMRQGFATMSPATKEFERALLSRRIAHSGHAVLRWCVGNVVLDEDAAGNVKPNKARSPDRIDGAVAAIMALARAAAAEHGPSIYDDAGARPEGFVFI